MNTSERYSHTTTCLVTRSLTHTVADHCIFTVESAGSMAPEQIVHHAIDSTPCGADSTPCGADNTPCDRGAEGKGNQIHC